MLLQLMATTAGGGKGPADIEWLWDEESLSGMVVSGATVCHHFMRDAPATRNQSPRGIDCALDRVDAILGAESLCGFGHA